MKINSVFVILTLICAQGMLLSKRFMDTFEEGVFSVESDKTTSIYNVSTRVLSKK